MISHHLGVSDDFFLTEHVWFDLLFVRRPSHVATVLSVLYLHLSSRQGAIKVVSGEKKKKKRRRRTNFANCFNFHGIQKKNKASIVGLPDTKHDQSAWDDNLEAVSYHDR
ncbi:hypothetical protein AWENTII_001772 [Aspergillus wentii]